MIKYTGTVKESRLRDVLRFTSDKVKTKGPFWIGDSGDAARLYVMRARGEIFSVHFSIGIDKGTCVDFRARPQTDPVIARVSGDGEGYADAAARIEKNGFIMVCDYDTHCYVCGSEDCEC